MQRFIRTSNPTVFKLGRFFVTADTKRILYSMGRKRKVGKGRK